MSKLYVSDTELIKEWDFNKNKESPDRVSVGSGKKVWWVCDKSHGWEATPNKRYKGTGCPCCSGRNVCADNCLSTIRQDIAKQWDYERNGKLTPRDVTCCSGKVVYWFCESGHSWPARISDRYSGSGCPYCSGRKVCKDNCLAELRPDLLMEWDTVKNGGLTPYDVTVSSSKKVWWLCSNGHGWRAFVYNRLAGKGCPYCSNNLVCGSNCIVNTHKVLVREWHPTKNGKLTPNDVTHGSEKKVWWLCSKCGNEWKSFVYHRTKGHGCPQCANGPVSKISQEWLDSFNILQENREILLPDLKIRVDAFVPETNTVYEFFGDYWHGNPEIFSPGEKNSHNGKTFGELYNETKARISRLEWAGYKVTYIWENDFNKKQNSTTKIGNNNAII